jgi:glycosyltransferase involved in cell wall biosynthesis
MKVLVILHNADLSGAPLMGVSIACSLKEHYQVDLWSPVDPSEAFTNHLTNCAGLTVITGNVDLNSYDLFICNSCATAMYANKLIEMKKRVVLWVHEDLHFFDIVPPDVLNKVLLEAYALIFVSNHCAYNTFSRWVWMRKAQRVFVVPNTVTGLTQKLRHPGGQDLMSQDISLSILHIGSNHYVKGTDRVIGLASYLANEGYKNIMFTLMGKNGYLEAERRYDLENVTYLGAQPKEYVLSQLSTFDISLQPSRHDNQPLTVLESLGSGTPVLSGPLPSIAQYADASHGFFEYDFTQPNFDVLIRYIFDVSRQKASLPGAFSPDAFKDNLKFVFGQLQKWS